MSERRRKNPDVYQQVRQAAEAFKNLTDPTPGDYTDYWRERWEAFGTLVGIDVTVDQCDRSHEEVQMLRAQGGTLLVRPPELTLTHLGQIHPNLQSWATQAGNSVNSEARFGWLDVEDSTDAPNLATNMDDLAIIARGSGKYGMTLETYIIGALDHFDRTGEYFDHNFQTYSRLPGSRLNGHFLGADFDKDGGLYVSSWDPNKLSTIVGGRLEGVK